MAVYTNKTPLSALLLVLTSLFLLNCATQAPPPGGEKDVDPPKIALSNPTQNGLNFSQKTITIDFDEWIKLDNIKQNLIIAPSHAGNFEAKTRKKQLILTFDSAFKANTTYIFDFGKSIQDITENNPAKNLRFVFSTGPMLDSLEIKGVVKELLTGKPMPFVEVMLFLPADTLVFKKTKPQYLTRTDAEGNFLFSNLPKGDFSLLALADKNTNYIWNKGEKHAFFPDVITTDTAVKTSHLLNMVNTDLDSLKVLYAKRKDNFYEIKCNKTPYQLKFESNAEGHTAPDAFGAVWDQSNVNLFAKNPVKDSIQVSVTLTDSSMRISTYTFWYDMSKNVKEKKSFFDLKINPQSNKELVKDSLYTIEIQGNKPILSFQADSFYIYNTVDSTLRRFAPEDFTLDAFQNKLSIKNFSIQNKSTLIAPAGSLFSFDADSSKEIRITYSLASADNYGVIKGKIETEQKAFWLELLGDKMEVEQSIFSPAGQFTFRYVKPGAKMIRIRIDENQDGVWYGGNLFEGIMPEAVYLYEKPITIKANWEVDDIKISF